MGVARPKAALEQKMNQIVERAISKLSASAG
jgi:hypothetical protein